MTKLHINRFGCSALLALFCWYGPAAVAQTAKPAAAKTTAAKNDPSCAATCAKGGMACCKGTPTRAAVLAANTSKKPVKK